MSGGVAAVDVLMRRSVVSRRQLYMIVIPSALAAVGLTAYTGGTEPEFAFAAAAMSAIGIFALADLVLGKGTINCGKMFGTGLLLAYGMTSLNTWYTVQPGLAAFVEVDQRALSEAIAVVAYAAALLFAVGEAAGWGISLDMRAVVASAQARWFVVTSFCILVAAFAEGGLGYMGVQGYVPGAANLLAWMGLWLAPPLFGITLAVALHESDRILRALFYVLLCAEALLTLPLGRRVFIYTLFLGGIVSRFCPSRQRPRPFRRALVIAAAIACIYFASIAFLYMRFATDALFEEAGDFPTLSRTIGRAYELTQVQSYDEVSQALKDNALRRGFILDFVAEILEGTEKYGTAHGQDMVNALTAEIPAALWKGKQGQLPPGEEELAGSVFQTTFPDSALSTVTGGALDFGVPGALLYPLAAALTMTMFLRAVGRGRNRVVAAAVTIGGIYLMLNTQAGAAETIAFIRNSVLFAAALHVVSWLRPTRPKVVGSGLD